MHVCGQSARWRINTTFGGGFLNFAVCILVCGKQNVKSILINMSEKMPILNL
jgi:hypothetical protein